MPRLRSDEAYGSNTGRFGHRGDRRYDALVSTGLTIPKQLNDFQRRTIFDGDIDCRFYDQIASFTGNDGGPRLLLRHTGQGGGFRFENHMLGGLTNNQKGPGCWSVPSTECWTSGAGACSILRGR